MLSAPLMVLLLKKKTAGLEGGVSPTVCQIPALGNEGHYVNIGMSAGFFNVDQIA
jgi:hypothetical protein